MPNHIGRIARVVMCALSLAALASCATVTVQRVKSDDYKTKGVRYYLPRPYVVVEQPFPVAGGQYIISGTANADSSVTIPSASIPTALSEFFLTTDASNPLTIPAGAISPPVAQVARQYSQAPQIQGASPTTTTPTTAPVVRTTPAETKWLEGSAVTPSILPASASGFEVSIKLSKEAEFVSITNPEVVLVPRSGDTFDPHLVIPLTDLISNPIPFKKGETDGVYKARGRRTDLTKGSMYAIGLRFDDKPSPTADPVKTLIHTPGLSLFAENVPEAQKKPETKTEDSTEKISEAGATFAGASDSKPVVPVNDYFQIVYLPDFDQQYAVRTTGGLGVAKLNMALENGWQAERITTEIDNRELGRFIFRQIDKFTDIAAEALKGWIAPLALVTPPTDNGNQTQGKAANAPVLLRITYMIEAQPGLYPVLKPNEATPPKQGQKPTEQSAAVFIPYPPYTVVAYNVRRYILIERVNTPPAPSSKPGSNSPPNQIADLGPIKAAMDECKIKANVESATLSDNGVLILVLEKQADQATVDAIVGCTKIKGLNLVLDDSGTSRRVTSIVVQQPE